MGDNTPNNKADQQEQSRGQENKKRKGKAKSAPTGKPSENSKKPQGAPSAAKSDRKPENSTRQERNVEKTDDTAKFAASAQSQSQKTRDLSAEFSQVNDSIQKAANQIIEEFRRSSTESSRLLDENKSLNAKLTSLNIEVSSLNNAKSELEQSLSKRAAELLNKEIELHAAQAKIANLEQQLEDTAQQLNNVQEMNEAMSAKARAAFAERLKSSLMVSYEDFRDYADAQCSEDNFDTYRAIIRSIFRTLSSNGIKFTEE